jgi:hypothetical protein
MQKPSAASHAAAAASARSSHRATPNPAVTQRRTATVLMAAPMPWAKRFGGPGVGRAGQGRAGASTRVASCPRGLRVGPVSTLAQKP